MSNFISDTTLRYVPPELPVDVSAWPELAEAAENHRRLEREFRECAAAHEAAVAALQQAVADDRAKLAQARLDGAKKLPGADAIEKAEAAVKEAKRQVDAADDARRQAAMVVVEVVETNRVAWLPEADGAIETARVDEAAALTAYLEAATASTIARQVRHWLQHFPEKGSRVKGVPVPLRHVGRLDPIAWGDVVYGLSVRAGLAAPPPRTLREQVEARGLTPAAVIGGPSEGEAA